MKLRRAAPEAVKVPVRRVARRVGRATAGGRMRPAFIVIGAQRCGTTSLFRALMSHPAVFPPVFHKGVNYFDLNYQAGPAWYYGHFPLHRIAQLRAGRSGCSPVTFEASGYYVYHPCAAERIARDLPSVKLLLMVRDPVERAYSAHRHELARGFETEPFERALELEDQRLEGEVERMLADPMYQSHSHRHHSYRRRGHYAEQLERFLAFFPAEHLHVVESERFFTRPQPEYARILDFLGLPVFMPDRFDQWNSRPRAPMADQVRRELDAYFAPLDERLAALLGRVPAWRCPSASDGPVGSTEQTAPRRVQ
jgi:hypothetical protein